MSEEDYINLMKKVRKLIFSEYMQVTSKLLICSNLNEMENARKLERVKEKYIWFSRYYNSAIEENLINKELLINLANL